MKPIKTKEVSANLNLTDESFEHVPTKASLQNKNCTEGFAAKVFKSDKPKIRTNKSDDFSNSRVRTYATEINTHKVQEQKDFNIKKAKHEVINFAISGSTELDKKNAQIALAIKLGAKPAKKEYKNYKELLNEKRLKKEKEDQIGEFSLLGKNQYGASNTKCRKKRGKVIVGQISKNYGVVGTKNEKK